MMSSARPPERRAARSGRRARGDASPAVASPASPHAEVTAGAAEGRAVPAALEPEEWQAGIAQRGKLMILNFREPAMALMATTADGEEVMVSIDRDQRFAVAAAALHGDVHGFTSQDYDDEVLTAVLLSSYARGVAFSELAAPLREAFHDLVTRRGDLARRIAALIAPAD